MIPPRSDPWPDDLILIDNLRAGQSKGLEGLFHRYFSSLVAFARRFTRDQDAARDVVQDVFFRLWKNRESLKITSSVKSYLFRSVRNQSLNLLRDHPDWEPLRPEDEGIAGDEDMTYVLADENQSRQQAVKEAVAKLPGRAKTIFELSRFEGLTYKEIAEFMDISEKTVENQMRISMLKLREWLCMLLLMAGAMGNFDGFLSLISRCL